MLIIDDSALHCNRLVAINELPAHQRTITSGAFLLWEFENASLGLDCLIFRLGVVS
jgi:hypothetical protein